MSKLRWTAVSTIVALLFAFLPQAVSHAAGNPGRPASTSPVSTHCGITGKWIGVVRGPAFYGVNYRQWILGWEQVGTNVELLLCFRAWEVKPKKKVTLQARAFTTGKKSVTKDAKSSLTWKRKIPRGGCVAINLTVKRPGPNKTLIGPWICDR